MKYFKIILNQTKLYNIPSHHTHIISHYLDNLNHVILNEMPSFKGCVFMLEKHVFSKKKGKARVRAFMFQKHLFYKKKIHRMYFLSCILPSVPCHSYESGKILRTNTNNYHVLWNNNTKRWKLQIRNSILIIRQKWKELEQEGWHLFYKNNGSLMAQVSSTKTSIPPKGNQLLAAKHVKETLTSF